MRYLSLFLLIIAPFIASIAQTTPFEGTIEFKKIKKGKTSSYIYYVKGDIIRLEEYGPMKTIVDIALIDLKKKKVFLISPERQSYMELKPSHTTKNMSNTRVEMKSERKSVLNHECKKWVVSNKDLNAKVTYWVTKGNYNFFVELLGVLHRKDYHSLFFQQVPEAVGYFPMQSLWTDLSGVERERLEVVSIKPHIIHGNLFTIPSEYTEITN